MNDEPDKMGNGITCVRNERSGDAVERDGKKKGLPGAVARGRE